MSAIARSLPVVGDIVRERGELRQQLAEAQTNLRFWRYSATRFQWQMKALVREHFGAPNPTRKPPREIPPELLDRFTMNGAASIDYNYLDCTYPDNYPLIYTDEELDSYIDVIKGNLAKPRAERDWFIYGGLDQDLCDALERHPIAGKSVVHMGSLTPWYEAMSLVFGATSTTIDYNRILLRTKRINFLTVAEYEQQQPTFDAALSISSFEHDGLGMYGDPLDPDGDLKAMQKMKRIVKPGGLLYLAVPTGRDRILFNNARIYGRKRLELLTRGQGWEWVDSFGFSDELLDGGGEPQPVYVLRNGS